MVKAESTRAADNSTEAVGDERNNLMVMSRSMYPIVVNCLECREI